LFDKLEKVTEFVSRNTCPHLFVYERLQMNNRQLKYNIILLICTIALLTLTAEGAFRARAYIKENKAYALRDIVVEKLEKGDYSRNPDAYGSMIRLSRNEGIVFELKPRLNWGYAGAKVETNLMGFRDKHYEFYKPEGTVRIFGIGDSIMFGQGVDQEKIYMAVLEDSLNEKFPDKKWEAINSGAPEYNTYMEVETLKAKGLRYNPDIVLIGFCANDTFLPKTVAYLGLPPRSGVGKYLAYDKSYLYYFIRKRLDNVRPDWPQPEGKYDYMGGGQSVEESLRRLGRISKEHDFEVVVLFLTHNKGPVEKEVMRIASVLGMHIVDMEASIRDYMKKNGIKNYNESEMVVPDLHPSAITHRLTAEALLDYFINSGLISNNL
jgi:hypothetical protein